MRDVRGVSWFLRDALDTFFSGVGKRVGTGGAAFYVDAGCFVLFVEVWREGAGE